MKQTKYKLVRRGPKYCVRVKGVINATDSFRWCRERNMSYHVKRHWIDRIGWDQLYAGEKWDYDFIFDKNYEATAFIMGYIL